jgi:hypothetical protein
MTELPTIFAFQRSALDVQDIGRISPSEVSFDVTRGVVDYERELVRAGPLRASWKFVEGERGVTLSGVRYWFKQMLLARIDEMFDGQRTWSGRVWEMTYEEMGVRLTKTMDGMANAVNVDFRSTTGDLARTHWDPDAVPDNGLDAESIGEFGRFDAVVTINTTSATEALERQAAELAKRKNPYTLPPSFTDRDGPATIEITAVGAPILCNSRYILPGELCDFASEAPEITVSELIEQIVEDFCGDWLTVVSIAENDTVTVQDVPQSVRAWDRLEELVALRDSDGNRFEMIITPDYGFIYQQLDETPVYIWLPPPDGIVRPDRKTPTWDARPAVVQIYDPSVLPELPDSGMSATNLALIERVSMQQGAPRASFHSAQLTDEDWRVALEAHTRWLDNRTRAQERAAGGGRGEDDGRLSIL